MSLSPVQAPCRPEASMLATLGTHQGTEPAFSRTENFSKRLCSRFRKQGNTPPVSILLRASARIPRGLQRADFESRFMRRIFNFFCVVFSPFLGCAVVRLQCFRSRRIVVGDLVVVGLISHVSRRHPCVERSSGPSAGPGHRPSHPRPGGPCRTRPSWSRACRWRGGRSS